MNRVKSAASTGSRTPGSARSGRTNRTSSTKKSVGKDDLQYPCIACKREGNSIEATNYCTECAENLCANCVKQHLKFPTMKNHKILGKSERRSPKEDTTPGPSVLACTEHPDKVVDMYCADHDELWCGACIATNHRHCSNTTHILDAARGVRDTKEYDDVKENSQTAKIELTALKKRMEKSLVYTENQKSSLMAQIKEARKKIDKALDDMETDTVRELERATGRLTAQTGEDLKLCNTVLSNLDTLIGLLSSKTEEVSEEEEPAIFVGVKRAKERIDESERIRAFTRYIMSNEPLSFTPDSRILDWLRSLRQLGAFSYQQTQYTATLISNFNVRQPTDLKECDIFGCAIFHDGRALLTDWDNKNVKLLDRSYYVIDQASLPGNPDDVCCINPQEAVISLTMQKRLQFLSVGKTITLTRSLHTEENCRGLAYHNGEIFVVCGGFKNEDNGKIRVYSKEGNLNRIIEKNNSGQRIFASPISIAIASGGKMYHVTDGQRGIVTLTNRNDVVSVVLDNDTSWPCGICVDHNDNTLICSGKSSNVIQMCGLNKVGTLLTHTDGVKKPHSVCFDINNLRLILTMDKCRFINVYQLQGPSLTSVTKADTTPRVTIAKDEILTNTVTTKVLPKHSNESKSPGRTDTKRKNDTAKSKVEPKTNKEAKLKEADLKTKTEIKTKPGPKTTSTRPELKPKIDPRAKTMTEINLKQKSSTKVEKLDRVHTQMESIAISDETIADDLAKLLTADNKQITTKDLRSSVNKILNANVGGDPIADDATPDANATSKTTKRPESSKNVAKEKTIVRDPVKEKTTVDGTITKEKTTFRDAATQDNNDSSKEEKQEYSLRTRPKEKSPRKGEVNNGSSKPERTNSQFSVKALNREKTSLKDTKTSPRKAIKSVEKKQ